MSRFALCILRVPAVVLAVGLAAATVPPATAHAASTLTTTTSPTYQTNGRVSAIVTVGDTTYLAGAFTSVRPAGAAAGTQEVPRQHLAAVNSATGALLPWNPGSDGAVNALAASPDGSTIYAGGLFKTVGGLSRKRLAAISAVSGDVTAFRADTNYKVHAVAATADRVYLGGTFSLVNGQARTRLAAVDITGRLVPDWQPTADDAVRAITVPAGSTDIWVGGDFTGISGDTSQDNLAKLSAPTGAPRSLERHPTWPVHAVVVTGDQVVAGGDGSGGNMAAYDTAGAVRWSRRTDGGVQGLALLDGVLYVGGHFDNVCLDSTCGSTVTRRKLLALDAATGDLDAWNPGANSALGIFALDSSGGRLRAGGTFTKLGTRYSQGYGQFG